MTSLSLPHSLPRALPPPRIGAPPSFHRFALFRRSSVNLRASLDSQPSRLSVRLPAAANRSVTAKLQVERFASISSSNNQETSVGVNPQYPVPPPPSNIGSPLFWIGCGVVFSAVFSWVAGKLKGSQNGAAFKQGIDASMSFEATGKVYLDIWIGEAKSPSSEEALEKFLQDPTVQKRVYPYLPEDWRNPTTLKWLFINPQQPQQIHDMLRNMSRSSEWDKRLVDSLENFDPTSPEVKQAFDQLGLTHEEALFKMVENPDVGIAFLNPRVQAAIMDCSQDARNFEKYQYDKEVMYVFNRMSELFPVLVFGPP